MIQEEQALRARFEARNKKVRRLLGIDFAFVASCQGPFVQSTQHNEKTAMVISTGDRKR